jgi:predicted nucleic acid-binding protein
MERRRYLIDSNVVIDYLGNKIPSPGMALMNDVLDTDPNVSVITKIEILGFNAPKEHQQLLESFMNDVNIIDLGTAIVDRTIAVRKSFKTKLPDAIIAATALVINSTLITRNTSDFKNIEGLDILDPFNVI